MDGNGVGPPNRRPTDSEHTDRSLVTAAVEVSSSQTKAADLPPHSRDRRVSEPVQGSSLDRLSSPHHPAALRRCVSCRHRPRPSYLRRRHRPSLPAVSVVTRDTTQLHLLTQLRAGTNYGPRDKSASRVGLVEFPREGRRRRRQGREGRVVRNLLQPDHWNPLGSYGYRGSGHTKDVPHENGQSAVPNGSRCLEHPKLGPLAPT